MADKPAETTSPLFKLGSLAVERAKRLYDVVKTYRAAARGSAQCGIRLDGASVRCP
jgi:hypothetical protein